MDYKSMMGYGKKKKVIKEQPKPRVNKVLKGIKKELNESRAVLGMQTLKDNPPFQTPKQLKEVGAAVEYRKYIKKIDKTRNDLGKATLTFYELLRKKGADDAAEDLLDDYKDGVIKFGLKFKKLIGKLL